MNRKSVNDYVNEDFWTKCLARPNEEEVTKVLRDVCDYTVRKLSSRIDKVEARGKGEALSFFLAAENF